MRAMRLRRVSIRTAAPLSCAIRSRKTFSIPRLSCAARPTEPSPRQSNSFPGAGSRPLRRDFKKSTVKAARMQPGSPVWSRTLLKQKGEQQITGKRKTFTSDRSTGRDSSGSLGNTLPGTGEGPTIAAGPLATLLCCGGSPLFLFFPPPCCETAMPENEVGNHYYLLAARSAPHWLNKGGLAQRCRLEPHPRVGPVRAIRDRLRYRFRSQLIIENYQACGLPARLLPPSRSPRRA